MAKKQKRKEKLDKRKQRRESNRKNHLRAKSTREFNKIAEKAEATSQLGNEDKIEQLRKLWQKYADIANERVNKLQDAKIFSLAYDSALQQGRDYFGFDDMTTPEQLNTEVTRIRVFLNDPSSTIEGAKIENARMDSQFWKNAFGNQYNDEKNGYRRYDTERIDYRLAQSAFRVYRKVEAVDAAGIMSFFGSEELIMMIYDEIYQGYDEETVLGSMLQKIDTAYQMNQREWRDRFNYESYVPSISGFIERMEW